MYDHYLWLFQEFLEVVFSKITQENMSFNYKSDLLFAYGICFPFYFPSVSQGSIVIESVGRLSTFTFSRSFMTLRRRRNRCPFPSFCPSVRLSVCLPSRIFIRQIISESIGPNVVKFCIYIRNIM